MTVDNATPQVGDALWFGLVSPWYQYVLLQERDGWCQIGQKGKAVGWVRASDIIDRVHPFFYGGGWMIRFSAGCRLEPVVWVNGEPLRAEASAEAGTAG